jgi:lipopolysaccharide biosynthesis glycosyltransferase
VICSVSGIAVISAVDEGYAMPLAGMVHSVLDTCPVECDINLFVLDGGVSGSTREKLQSGWRDRRLRITWLQPDLSSIADLAISNHVSRATYLRLLMDTVLPEGVNRLVYLDADVLVRRDLSALWGESLHGNVVFAAQDAGAPVMDAVAALPSYERCKEFLISDLPVPNYRDLGLAADRKYFNAGAMLIDVEAWREREIGRRCLALLREQRDHAQWWDQYAMNVILDGCWGELDPRWNQGARIYAYPSWDRSPFDEETYRKLQDDPWIVHFSAHIKPWHYHSDHPYTAEFRAKLRHTAWADWKPSPLDNWAKPETWRQTLATMWRGGTLDG